MSFRSQCRGIESKRGAGGGGRALDALLAAFPPSECADACPGVLWRGGIRRCVLGCVHCGAGSLDSSSL